MKKKAPSAYHHGDLRAACIELALRLISRGELDFSLRDLARRLQVSHQAPYHYFKSRNELLEAICEQGFEEFWAVLREARSKASSPREALRKIGLAYLGFASRRPHHYRLMFVPLREHGRTGARKPDFAPKAFEELRMVVEELKQEGFFEANSATDVAVSFWGWVHGLTLLQSQGQLEWLGYPRDPDEAVFDRWFSAFMI